MPDTDLVYARPSDNIAHRVLASAVTSSGLAAGTLASIYDRDPASAITLSGGSPAWLRWDFSGLSGYGPLKWVVFLALEWANTGTRTITFQANSSDSWAAPPVSVPVTPPTVDANETEWPVNFAIDLTHLTGVYTNAHTWVRLLFTDSGSPEGVAPTIGDVFLATSRRTLTPLGIGWQKKPEYPSIVHRTPAGRRLAYSQDVRQYVIRGRQVLTDDEWADVEFLHEDTRGPVTPFPLQLVPDEQPLFVTFDDLDCTRIAEDRNDVAMRFVEVVSDRVG